mgnify:CR=1 FL=1
MSSRFGDFLKERDIYGQPISINYKGSDVFKTKIGALVSLLTYMLIIFNLVNLTRAFMDGSKQDETTSTVSFNRFEAGPFNLQEN